MKKIFILIAILFSMISITFAADSEDDCLFFLNNTLAGWDENNNDEIVANLSKAMPKEAIEQAYKNLKAYCCDAKKGDMGLCEKNNDDTVYPESIYLFDHILDVYLRRLDAKQKNENGEDLLYNLEPDDMGKEWRDFITARGNDVKGSLPLEIKEKFSAMWKLTAKVTTYFGNDEISIKNWETSLEENIKNYDNWTLWDKYNLACDLSKYISENQLHISSQKLSTEEYDYCKDLTNKRISNEKIYTQLLLMQKANVLLGGNIKSYLNTYFVANKLSELQDKIFNVSSMFSEVNTAVLKLTHDCES